MAPRRPKRQQKRSATDTQGGGNENEKENSASNANNKKKCTDAAKKKTNRPSSQAPSKTTDGSTVKDAGGNGVKDQRPEWLQRGEQGARGANDKDSTATRGAWPPAQPPALPYAPPADGNKTQTTDDGRNPKAAATNTNVGDDGNIPLGSEWGGNPSTVSDASVVNMETATTTSNNDNASISSMSVVSTTTCYKSRATKNLNVSDTSKKVFTRTDLYRAEKFMTNPEKHLSDAKPKNAKDKETGVVYRKLVQYMRNINALKPTETYRVSEADKSLIISCLNQKRGETTTEVKNGITGMNCNCCFAFFVLL